MFGEIEFVAAAFGDGFEHGNAGRRNFGADAVAGEDYNVCLHAPCSSDVCSLPSFPRKRESIFCTGPMINMDSRLRGNDD
jgi:hypothetical protein